MSYTQGSINRMLAKAATEYKENKKFLKKLVSMKPQKLDGLVLDLHTAEFEKIECLECANCCKTISPAMNDSDVRRMAQALKMKVGVFTDTYVRLDEEGDYVFRQAPCPFLGSDNYCSIYASRPKACREYPHTDRKRFYQILDLTAQNTKTCPAVFSIVGHLRDHQQGK